MREDDQGQESRLQLVAALLRSQSTLTLSTCDEDGWPHATPLFYHLHDDMRLYWFSSPQSVHSRHISREPRVAVAVSRPTEQWREIRGVQMHGDVTVVAGQMRKTVTASYCERFHLGAMFGLAIMKSRLFGFQPSWIRYLDNAKGLGYKFEITLPRPSLGDDSKAGDVCEGGVRDDGRMPRC